MVVVTQARVRAWFVLPRFVFHAVSSMAAARAAPGNTGARMFLRGPFTWCTVTGWTDPQAMQAYVRAGAHRDAMRLTRALTRSTRFARLDGLTFGEVDIRQARAALDRASPGPPTRQV